MALTEPTGIHCAFCNGAVFRHREWGICWLECGSCGSQRAMACTAAKVLRQSAYSVVRRSVVQRPSARRSHRFRPPRESQFSSSAKVGRAEPLR